MKARFVHPLDGAGPVGPRAADCRTRVRARRSGPRHARGRGGSRHAVGPDVVGQPGGYGSRSGTTITPSRELTRRLHDTDDRGDVHSTSRLSSGYLVKICAGPGPTPRRRRPADEEALAGLRGGVSDAVQDPRAPRIADGVVAAAGSRTPVADGGIPVAPSRSLAAAAST